MLKNAEGHSEAKRSDAQQNQCSLKHLLAYKNIINDYLSANNINDFTKYEISLKNDKVNYIRWGYNINRLENFSTIVPLQNQTFLELNTRVIIFNIKKIWSNMLGGIVDPNVIHWRRINRPIYFNILGNLVDEKYMDDYYIEYITSVNIEKNNKKWEWIGDQENHAENGLIKIGDVPKLNNKEDSTGNVRIIFFYSHRIH